MTRAAPGDRITAHSDRVGRAGRSGEVVEVRGSDGGPPYVVRWSDSDQETIFFPGPGTVVHQGES